MKTQNTYKHDIKIKDSNFHKRLIMMKTKHGFSSIEAMLKGWEKVYKLYLNEALTI